MFGLYDHPATRFVCRHCKGDAGYEPEICIYCGPVYNACFDDVLNTGCSRHKTQPRRRRLAAVVLWIKRLFSGSGSVL